MTVAVLGLSLHLDATTEGYFNKHAQEAAEQGASSPALDQAIPLLQAGIAAAERIGVDAQIGELLPKAGEMTFKGLKELTSNFANARNTSRQGV